MPPPGFICPFYCGRLLLLLRFYELLQLQLQTRRNAYQRKGQHFWAARKCSASVYDTHTHTHSPCHVAYNELVQLHRYKCISKCAICKTDNSLTTLRPDKRQIQHNKRREKTKHAKKHLTSCTKKIFRGDGGSALTVKQLKVSFIMLCVLCKEL